MEQYVKSPLSNEYIVTLLYNVVGSRMDKLCSRHGVVAFVRHYNGIIIISYHRGAIIGRCSAVQHLFKLGGGLSCYGNYKSDVQIPLWGYCSSSYITLTDFSYSLKLKLFQAIL